MSLIPLTEGTTTQTAGPPVTTPPVAPAPSRHEAGRPPAEYDGSPPLPAWTWSWVNSGGSVVDLVEALRKADEIRAGGGLVAGAHARLDPHRALALLSG